jgi:hypothetical protein
MLSSEMVYTRGGFCKHGNIIPMELVLPSDETMLRREDLDCTSWGDMGGYLVMRCSKRNDHFLFTFSYVPNGMSPKMMCSGGFRLMPLR